jgi:hypothetical protein
MDGNRMRKLWLTTMLLAPIVLLSGGCQMIGAAYAKTMGPPKTPAAYTPPSVPTLILSEHAPAAAVDDISSEDIGRRVAAIWEAHHLSPLIDLSKLEELRLTRGDEYSTMSTVAIGKALGAKQVVYIDVRDGRVETAGTNDTIRAVTSVRVRVVDVASGQTLWPQQATEGYALDAQTPYAIRGQGVSESSQLELARILIAEQIGLLFYTHPSEPG